MTKRNLSDVDAIERTVIKRFRSYPPASFKDLINEGLITPGQENTMRDRLRGRLVVVGKRPSVSGRGRPNILYTVAPAQRGN